MPQPSCKSASSTMSPHTPQAGEPRPSASRRCSITSAFSPGCSPHPCWCIAASILGLAGGLMGHIIGFIDPREVAFAGASFGVWMVLMAILGGKGTIWGPVIGACLFHLTRELFWTYFFGWQNVALGVLIVVVVVFFPTGLLGWARQRYPRLFAADFARPGGGLRP